MTIKSLDNGKEFKVNKHHLKPYYEQFQLETIEETELEGPRKVQKWWNNNEPRRANNVKQMHFLGVNPSFVKLFLTFLFSYCISFYYGC